MAVVVANVAGASQFLVVNSSLTDKYLMCAYTVLLWKKSYGNLGSNLRPIGRSLVRLYSRTLTRSSHGNLCQPHSKFPFGGAVGEIHVRCETVEAAATLAARVRC
jgi:hypothetical protein